MLPTPLKNASEWLMLFYAKEELCFLDRNA